MSEPDTEIARVHGFVFDERSQLLRTHGPLIWYVTLLLAAWTSALIWECLSWRKFKAHDTAT